MAKSKCRPEDLLDAVRTCCAEWVRPGDRVLLGLSGGIDSVVLLDLAVRLVDDLDFQLLAHHVNHGLSPNAQRWAAFCGHLCARLDIPFSSSEVHVPRHSALGIEGAAREARYAALATVDAEVLLLAHHQDDQVETVLGQLVRGAGVRGLAGMPRVIERGGRRWLRPLLDFNRIDIRRYAEARDLVWVDDESNNDSDYDRNYLRLEVLPVIDNRFPGARRSLARAAGHMAEAQEVLDDMARLDLGAVDLPYALPLAPLQRLSLPRAKNLLRYFLHEHGCQPSAVVLEELFQQLLLARDDAQVLVQIGSVTARRYRQRLHLVRPLQVPRGYCQRWSGEEALALPKLGGVLRAEPSLGHGLATQRLGGNLEIRLREGGEHLRPGPHQPTRALKNLLQEHHLAPWERHRLPLLFHGQRLVCVPGIGVDPEWQAGPDEAGRVFHWLPE